MSYVAWHRRIRVEEVVGGGPKRSDVQESNDTRCAEDVSTDDANGIGDIDAATIPAAGPAKKADRTPIATRSWAVPNKTSSTCDTSVDEGPPRHSLPPPALHVRNFFLCERRLTIRRRVPVRRVASLIVDYIIVGFSSSLLLHVLHIYSQRVYQADNLRIVRFLGMFRLCIIDRLSSTSCGMFHARTPSPIIIPTFLCTFKLFISVNDLGLPRDVSWAASLRRVDHEST